MLILGSRLMTGGSILAAVLSLLLLHPKARGDDRSPEDFFETSIRPLLTAKCVKCHGGDDPEGELDLSTRAGVLAGGMSGEAIVPGKPEESLLVDAISYDFEPRMPPKGKLSDPEIAALTRWIALGARLARLARERPGGSGRSPPIGKRGRGTALGLSAGPGRDTP